MAQRCARERCGAVHRGHAGNHDDFAAAPARILRQLQALEHQRRHGVHTRVARAHERHPVSPGGERERLIHAIRLLAQRVGVPNLPAVRRHHVEIAPVPHEVRGPVDRAVRRGGPTFGRAWPEPDHRQRPAGPADLHGVDRPRRFANRAGGPPRLGLGHPQRAPAADRGERGRLRDTVAAHFPEHRIGRVGEPGRQRFQGRRIEESRRYPEDLGQRVHRRLVGLDVDGEHPGQRPGGQVGAGQRAVDQIHQLARRDAALATHPEREAPPVIHQGVFIARFRGVGHPHGKRRIGLELDSRTPQPVRFSLPGPFHAGRGRRITGFLPPARRERGFTSGQHEMTRLALQAAPFSGQQPGHERLAVMRIRQHPSGRWIVERDLPAALAGGGDRGGYAQRRAQAAGERIGAAMTAEERHHRACVLRDGDDGGLPALVGERGRQGPDQDARRAHADDVRPRGEQPAQLGADVVELDVGARNTRGIAVNPRTGQARPDPPGRGQSLLRQRDDGDRIGHLTKLRVRIASRSPRRQTFHASPRACSRIIEKYGAVPSATSASGRILSLAMVACST